MGSTPTPGTPSPTFLYVTCQVGAERALKAEVARAWPDFHFAYSRPGFLTFKLPSEHPIGDGFDLKSVFARAYGISLGKIAVESLDEAAAEVWRLAGAETFDALHVWQRDAAAVGYRGFEPHVTPAALAAEEAIRRQAQGDTTRGPLGRIAEREALVLDCVLVEPHEWWIGYHRATSSDRRYPGGLRDLVLPAAAVSRAYLKMQEALAWSELPIRAGEKCVEIGCAPGGASQALLDHGLIVTGIDPAAVDERVLDNPHFTHVRKRGADVRRREFRGITWLAADMNVAPQYTLDAVEAIVTHRDVKIRGLLLTLKLLDWKLADEIPEWIARIKSWGYKLVAARQLPHNRREICITALRRQKKK